MARNTETKEKAMDRDWRGEGIPQSDFPIPSDVKVRIGQGGNPLMQFRPRFNVFDDPFGYVCHCCGGSRDWQMDWIGLDG